MTSKKRSYKKTSKKKKEKNSFVLPSPQDIQTYAEDLGHYPSIDEIIAFFKIGKKYKKDLKKHLKKGNSQERHNTEKLPASLKKEAKIPKILQAIITKKEHDYFVAKPTHRKSASYIFHVRLPEKEHLAINEKILILRKNLIKKNIYKATLLKKIGKPTLHVRKVVGIVQKLGRKTKLIPVDRRLSSSYQILDGIEKATSGALVEASIVRDYGKSGGCVSIDRILCNKDNPKFISYIELYQSDIPNIFSQKALDLADSAKLPSSENREDLRDIPFVTIDQEDAKDFDDAVFAKKTKQGWHIIVAIADVSYYVPAGSILDKEAYERGNSTYFPNFVVPMLPESLSNGMCSLKPNEDRASLAVHMWISTKGILQDYRFSRALIRSHARLTYNLVQQVYNAPETNSKVWELIKPLFQAYKCLQHEKLQRKTLELDIEEPQIIFGAGGVVQEIVSRQRLESHKLIEEMMILANVSAAKALSEKNIPALFRVHEKPLIEKVTLLLNTLSTMGIDTANATKKDPCFFNAILEKTKDTPTRFLVQDMVLRTQAQAVYRPENTGHFGLNLEYYTHFTSPIRRYADLVVHRSLITALQLGPGGWKDVPTLEALSETGEHLSSTERASKSAERSTLNRYMISYLEDKIGAQFHAHISGVHTAGIFIELDDTGAEGFLPKSNLPYDIYRLSEKKPCLQGRKHSFTLGDPIRVKLKEANAYKNGMTFSFMGK